MVPCRTPLCSVSNRSRAVRAVRTSSTTLLVACGNRCDQVSNLESRHCEMEQPSSKRSGETGHTNGIPALTNAQPALKRQRRDAGALIVYRHDDCALHETTSEGDDEHQGSPARVAAHVLPCLTACPLGALPRHPRVHFLARPAVADSARTHPRRKRRRSGGRRRDAGRTGHVDGSNARRRRRAQCSA